MCVAPWVRWSWSNGSYCCHLLKWKSRSILIRAFHVVCHFAFLILPRCIFFPVSMVLIFMMSQPKGTFDDEQFISQFVFFTSLVLSFDVVHHSIVRNVVVQFLLCNQCFSPCVHHIPWQFDFFGILTLFVTHLFNYSKNFGFSDPSTLSMLCWYSNT